MQINVVVSAHFSIYGVWFCKINSNLLTGSEKKSRTVRKRRLEKYFLEVYALQNFFLRQFFIPGDKIISVLEGKQCQI